MILISIVAVALAFAAVQRGGNAHLVQATRPLFSAHAMLGLFITLAALAQGALGYAADKLWSLQRKHTPLVPDKLHWYLGRLLAVLGAMNVLFGIFLYSTPEVPYLTYFLKKGIF